MAQPLSATAHSLKKSSQERRTTPVLSSCDLARDNSDPMLSSCDLARDNSDPMLSSRDLARDNSDPMRSSRDLAKAIPTRC